MDIQEIYVKMIEYIPLILICNAVLPDTECKDKGKDVTTVVGEPQRTPMSCLIEGTTKIASLAFAPRMDEKFYVRIKCIHRDTGESVN